MKHNKSQNTSEKRNISGIAFNGNIDKFKNTWEKEQKDKTCFFYLWKKAWDFERVYWSDGTDYGQDF